MSVLTGVKTQLLSRPLVTLLLLMAFIFPLGMPSLKSWSSSLVHLFIFIGLLSCRKQWQFLTRAEKRLFLCLGLFFLLCSMSLLNADDLSYGIKRLGKLVLFLGFIPAYLGLCRARISLVRPLMYGLLAAGPINLGLALYSMRVWGRSQASWNYNSIVFGDLCMFLAIAAGCLFFTRALPRRFNPLILGSLLCSLCACALSGSRGAWILLPIILLFFLWLFRKQISIRHVALFMVLIVVFGAAVFALGGKTITSRVSTAYHEVLNFQAGQSTGGSAGQRLEMWRISLDIWSRNPVLGSGIGDFRHDVIDLRGDGEALLVGDFSHAHSIYFEYLSMTGILGFFSMLLAVLVLPFRYFYGHWLSCTDSEQRFAALAGMTLVVSFAVFGLTESWLSRSPFVSPYVLSLLILMSGCSGRSISCPDPD